MSGPIAAALRELMTLGVEGEALILAVGRIETAMQPKDTAGDKRRAYDRDRKRTKANSTGIPPETAESNVTTIPPEFHRNSTGNADQSRPRVRDNLPRLVTSGEEPSEPKGSSGAGRVVRLRPSRRCPSDYEPTRHIVSVAETEGLMAGEIEREMAKMKDHLFQRAHTDWDAACRNWLRRAAEDKNRRGRQSQPSSKLAAKQDNIARSLAGLDAVIGSRDRG